MLVSLFVDGQAVESRQSLSVDDVASHSQVSAAMFDPECESGLSVLFSSSSSSIERKYDVAANVQTSHLLVLLLNHRNLSHRIEGVIVKGEMSQW